MTSSLNTSTIPKASELSRWKNPYKVVSFLDQEREKVYCDLPGYKPCPILTNHIWDVTSCPKSLHRFLKKLSQEESFFSLCLLAVFDIVLHHSTTKNNDKNKWEEAFATEDKNKNIPMTIQDEDNSLIVEAWPLIQDKISWDSFLTIYQKVQSQLCIITLDEHPLGDYAKRDLFEIPNFDEAIEIAHSRKFIPIRTRNKLQACQLFLDHVASLPKRVFGILIRDPLDSSNNEKLPPQSCLPTAYLDLSMDNETNDMTCRMVSLYELHPNESYTISTRPPSEKCLCFKCTYEKEKEQAKEGTLISEDWVSMAQRLAHVYFQGGNFEGAKLLYKKCHDYYSAQKNEEDAADNWHSMAAVSLTESKFLQAQEHWRQGSHYQSIHTGIALQMEKQKAYKYFETSECRGKKALPSYQAIGGCSRRLFLCPDMLPSSTCQQLIDWAKEYTSTSGWTSNRHYAVPTLDIPVHNVPKLLNWFVEWIRDDVVPLLQEQFQSSQQFYVHDAFLVRYSSCSSSRFLPLHYDESTHSLVLALNDDFEGGGTYFYSIDQTITPKGGSLVSFRGNQLLHGGNFLTKGERYILAVFLYSDQHKKRQSNTPDSLVSDSSKRLKESNGGFSFGFFDGI